MTHISKARISTLARLVSGILTLVFVVSPALAQTPSTPSKKATTKKIAKVAMVPKTTAKEPVTYAKNPDFFPDKDDTDTSVKRKVKPSDHPYHMKLEATTNAPVDIGGRLTLELPGRFRIMAGVGVMPSFYSSLINQIAVRAMLYDQTVAAILKTTLDNSLVWRIHGEWRAIPSAGFFIGFGYSQALLGGTVNGASIAGMSASLNVPASVLSGVNYQINSTLHMLSGEVGYEFSFFANVMTLRLALGFTGTIASKTNVQAQVAAGVPAQVAAAAVQAGAQAAAIFDTMYRDSVFSPTLSIGVGFKLF